MAGRLMHCNRCEAEWTALAELPSSAMTCPYCNVHVCGCGCGADLSDQRRDSIYLAESHWRQLQRAQSSDVAPIRTVADARALQEGAKAHWSMVADEGIFRHFKEIPGEPLHADDLRELGIPLEHCNVIPSQIAKWVNRRYMVSCGERKLRIPSRNAAKSKLYRLTEKGVEHVRKGWTAGDSSANGEGTAGLLASSDRTLDRPSTPPESCTSIGAPSSRTAVSGDPAQLPGLEQAA